MSRSGYLFLAMLGAATLLASVWGGTYLLFLWKETWREFPTVATMIGLGIGGFIMLGSGINGYACALHRDHR